MEKSLTNGSKLTKGKGSVWNFQFLICAGLLFGLSVLYSLNYLVLNEPFFCHDRPYALWVKDYTVIILGAAVGHVIIQYFRIFIVTQGYSDGKLRHPQATRMILLISTIQALASILFHFDLLPYRCIDSFGVATYPFMWFEWVCTVPFMFFLVSMLDVKKENISIADFKIQITGGGSVILLFLCNLLTVHRWILLGIFCLSNFMMLYGFYQLYHTSHLEYSEALKSYKNLVKKTEINKDTFDNYKVAQWKMNGTWFMIICFHFFPLIYYCQLLHLISPEVALIANVYGGFICKLIFNQILFDAHIEILDPNKFLLLEERRKSEESKLMFFRYVFHEVRVPLNSLVLGLQILQDNEFLSESDQETIGLMKDATIFMSETLNDVLSLQKIEEGMLELEFKPFTADTLVRSVLTNFKPQYESKKITVQYILEDNVPKYLMGDQFRLEHVLGNLVSNAIKFSENESKIIICVSYETRLPGHVTFAVEDEGPGMTEDEQKCLFQPFMQIRPGELQKGRGSGLGLSICKTIVNLHNGTIGCESKKRTMANDRSSGGTEFYFNIEFGLLPQPFTRHASIRSQSQKTDVKGDDDHSEASREGSLSVILARNDSSSVMVGERSTMTTWSPPFIPTMISETLKDTSTYSPNNNRNIFPNAHFLNKAGKSSYYLTATNLAAVSNESIDNSITASEPVSVVPVVVENISELNLSPEGKQLEIVETVTTGEDEGTNAINQAAKAVLFPTPPITEVMTSSKRSSEKESTLTSSTPSTRAMARVLVCDDVHSNRKMLEMILKKKGFQQTECCNDGTEAVALVQEKGLDYFGIIFMDNLMPNMCGPEAATKIRQLGYQHLLVGVTGNAMEVDVIEYETAGADAVMIKPVKMEYLQRLIEYCQLYGYQSTVHQSIMKSEEITSSSEVNEPSSTTSSDELLSHCIKTTNLPENRLKVWLLQGKNK